MIESRYIRKVEKGGEYANTPIATYPNQDRFWPYTDKEYLSFKYKYAELKGKNDGLREIFREVPHSSAAGISDGKNPTGGVRAMVSTSMATAVAAPRLYGKRWRDSLADFDGLQWRRDP